jgi:hypothetical protein
LRDQVPGVPQLPIEIAFLRSALPVGTGPAQSTPAATPMTRPAPQPIAPPVVAVEAGHPVARQPEPPFSGTAKPPASEHQPAPRPSPADAVSAVHSMPASDGDLLKAVRDNWDRFIKVAGQRCGMKLQAALRGVKQLDATGGVLVMQFSHAFSRDLVNQSENRVLVEGVWQEVLGRKIGLRCILAGETVLPPSTSSPPAGDPTPVPGNDDEVLLNDARKLGAVVTTLK